jgi:hypothetical protein
MMSSRSSKKIYKDVRLAAETGVLNVSFGRGYKLSMKIHEGKHASSGLARAGMDRCICSYSLERVSD